MITLNSEKGLVRIESWDDIESRPGFTSDVDPKTVKLKEIIGSYTFDALIPCGLSTCHQPHGTGFLVVTEDGRETNIGRICGKRHFSVEFTQMSRVFLREIRAQQNREALWEIKHRLPTVAAEVSALKSEQYGASWIYARINQLAGRTTSLPLPIVNAVRQAIRRGDGALSIQRATTADERDVLAASTQVTGLSRGTRASAFVEEQVGQLDGFFALATGNGLREILGVVEPFVSTLAEADIDSLSEKELRELSKVGAELDSNLQRLRAVIAAGRRLLTKANLSQLTQFATSRAESRLFESFLREMP